MQQECNWTLKCVPRQPCSAAQSAWPAALQHLSAAMRSLLHRTPAPGNSWLACAHMGWVLAAKMLLYRMMIVNCHSQCCESSTFGDHLHTPSSTVQPCACLQEIDVGFNRLDGNVDFLSPSEQHASLPSTFQFQLRYLRLDHNQLSGTISQLPLGPVEIIDPSNNRLVGSLPGYQSSTLSILRVNANKLSGSLPSNLSLPRLETLAMSQSGLRQTTLNARGEYLPSFLMFDKCAVPCLPLLRFKILDQ